MVDRDPEWAAKRIQAVEKAIDRLEELDSSRSPGCYGAWTRMSERRPEAGLHCLFLVPLHDYPNYMVAGFAESDDPDDEIMDLCGDTMGYDISSATHWIPLPEAP